MGLKDTVVSTGGFRMAIAMFLLFDIFLVFISFYGNKLGVNIWMAIAILKLSEREKAGPGTDTPSNLCKTQILPVYGS